MPCARSRSADSSRIMRAWVCRNPRHAASSVASRAAPCGLTSCCGGNENPCPRSIGDGPVTFDERIRPAAADPEGALVLLHGRGADEHDLHGLLDAIDPGRRLVGVTPRAPLALPPGGAHWYAVYRVGFPDPDTFWPTFRDLCAWYDALPERLGFPADRIVLGGFSQGCVMSYAVGLTAGRPAPRALLALSGFMPVVEGLELDLDRPGLELVIEHGRQDPVIGVD